MKAIEIIEALRSKEKALNELKVELEKAIGLDELFNPHEKAVLQRFISISEKQLQNVRLIIERRLEALETNTKYW